MRELFTLMRRETNLPPRIAHCGGVSLVHRAGSALNVNVHVHALVLDGVYTIGSGQASATFHPLATPPSSERADALVRRVLQEIRVLLRRRMESGALPMSRPALARLQAASVRHNLATGPRAGSSVRRVQAQLEARTRGEKRNRPAAAIVSSRREGATVHGGRRVEADERHAVLRLSRYLTRPPVNLDALEPTAEGRVRYALPRPLHDGTTHVEMSPQELAEKLVALVPAGSGKRVGYHGVLAPRAAHRWRVLPTQLMLVESDGPPAARESSPRSPRTGGGAPERDLLHCSSCDRPMQVVAVDEDGAT
jgi:hypothetical protein